MKKINYFSSVITATLMVFFSLTSCNKEEEPALTDESDIVASFSLSDTRVNVGDTVHFENTSENAELYIWGFGDGEVSNDENPSHAYTVAAKYRVKMIAVSDNVSDSAFAYLTVQADNPDDTTGASEAGIFEGKGITGVNIFESTWEDLAVYYGTDTTDYISYSTSVGYYHVITYNAYGLVFFLQTGLYESLAESTSNLVIGISVWGYNYGGGPTAAGINIGSTVDELKETYGEPDNSETGTSGEYNYTWYMYNTLGIDFLDFNEDYIYQIDIYSPYDNGPVINADVETMKEIFGKHHTRVFNK